MYVGIAREWDLHRDSTNQLESEYLRGMVVHSLYDPSTWEVEAGKLLQTRPD